MSENKYRIKIEPINGNNEELIAEWRMGIECEGFTIISDKGDDVDTSIHQMSIADVAHAIAAGDDTIQAAYIAVGIDKAKEARDRRRMKTAALKIDLGDIARRFGGGRND